MYDCCVVIRKAFRYRIYPTTEQRSRLTRWEHALRFLWNLALEQRLAGLAHPRSYRRYFTSFDQINELTELRSILPWLADVPRNVCAQLLIELDRAWQRCFKKTARTPRWKRKGQDQINFCEPHPKVWRLGNRDLRFPKLGHIRIVKHRPIKGIPKTCTISRDGDQWFVSIICEEEISIPMSNTLPTVALDRGVINLVGDSDGNLFTAPRPLERSLKRLARAQRTMFRRKKGSRRREKAKLKITRLHRKVRRQRNHFIHVLSAHYAKSHSTVIIERLNTKGMVRASRGLARGILDAAWGKLADYLRYKLAWSGGRLVEVSAAYSSQECSACGHINAQSRRSQAEFLCIDCGYSDHADINAAKTLLARANRSGLPVEGSLTLGTLRSGKSVRLRVPRRPPKNSVFL